MNSFVCTNKKKFQLLWVLYEIRRQFPVKSGFCCCCFYLMYCFSSTKRIRNQIESSVDLRVTLWVRRCQNVKSNKKQSYKLFASSFYLSFIPRPSVYFWHCSKNSLEFNLLAISVSISGWWFSRKLLYVQWFLCEMSETHTHSRSVYFGGPAKHFPVTKYP